MLGFLKTKNNKMEQPIVKMEQPIVKIIDVGHYREINTGSESPKIVKVLGESKEFAGMWVTSECDAKGINVLISEHVLNHSYEFMGVLPQYTEGNSLSLSNKKAHLFEGIGEDFEEQFEEQSKHENYIEEIKSDLISSYDEVQPDIETRKQISEKEIFMHSKVVEREFKNRDLPKNNTYEQNVVVKQQPIIDNEEVFLHKKVIEKFILPNGTKHVNNITFDLVTNVDLKKLIGGMELMDLQPEIVLDIMLQNSDFKKSLVQLFGGVLNEKNVLSDTMPDVQKDHQNNIMDKIIQHVGKENYQDIALATQMSEILEPEKMEQVLETISDNQNIIDSVETKEDSKSPWFGVTGNNISIEEKNTELSELEQLFVQGENSGIGLIHNSINNSETKILSKEEIERATQMMLEQSENDIEEFPDKSTDELFARIKEFNDKPKPNLE